MGGSDGNASGEMRKLENQQQKRVNQGLAQLAQVFGGKYGTTPVTGGHPGGKFYNKATTYKKGGAYYDAAGNAWEGTPKEAKQLIKQGGLFLATAESPAFGQDWMDERKQAYVDYAMPQVSEQAQRAWKQLAYSLSNRGLLKSGVAGQMRSGLETEIGRQKQGVANEAENQAMSMRQNLEGQRSNLTSQLIASGQPTATTQQALATAATAKTPSTFAPLGNLFQNWANMYLANQAMQTPAIPSLYGGSSGYASVGSGASPAVSSSSSRIVK